MHMIWDLWAGPRADSCHWRVCGDKSSIDLNHHPSRQVEFNKTLRFFSQVSEWRAYCEVIGQMRRDICSSGSDPTLLSMMSEKSWPAAVKKKRWFVQREAEGNNWCVLKTTAVQRDRCVCSLNRNWENPKHANLKFKCLHFRLMLTVVEADCLGPDPNRSLHLTLPMKNWTLWAGLD